MSIRLASSDYKEVEFSPSSAILKDTFVPAATLGGAINGFVGITNLAAAAPGTVVVKAECAIATKVAADTLAFAPGEMVRYNIAGAKVSKTGSDPLIGWAKKAAIEADTEVDVEFDGALAISSGEAITLAQITDLSSLEVTSAQVSDLDTTLAALTFAGLADVNAAGVTNNDTTKYDSATEKWVIVPVAD